MTYFNRKFTVGFEMSIYDWNITLLNFIKPTIQSQWETWSVCIRNCFYTWRISSKRNIVNNSIYKTHETDIFSFPIFVTWMCTVFWPLFHDSNQMFIYLKYSGFSGFRLYILIWSLRLNLLTGYETGLYLSEKCQNRCLDKQHVSSSWLGKSKKLHFFFQVIIDTVRKHLVRGVEFL